MAEALQPSGCRIRQLEGALEEIIRKTQMLKDPMMAELYFIARDARHGRINGEEVRQNGERRAS
jgi:hypothetical protein